MTRPEATTAGNALPRRVGTFRIPFLSQLGRTIEIAAVVGATLFAMLFWVRLPYRLPTAEDYQQAQHALLAASRPGDAVAVLPFWADRAKLYLHGLPVVALPDLANQDPERYQRLFVIAQPDLPRSSAPAEVAALGRKLALVSGPTRYGPLSLSLYQPRPEHEPSLDFTAQLERAQVEVGNDACTPVAGGFQCPRGAWDRVRAEWHEFDFLPRRCLWAEPTGAAPLVLTFDQVPLRAEIHGAIGMLSGGGGGATVSLAIDIDESPAITLFLPPGNPGFHPFETRFPDPGPGGHRVTFRISSAGGPPHPFCFDAVAF
jgi:hypothetical protein